MTVKHHLALFAILCLTGKEYSVAVQQECFVDGNCANTEVYATGDSRNLTTSSSFASSVIAEASYEIPPPAPETDAKLGSDMGETQALDDSQGEAILARIAQARDYMKNTVMVDDSFEKVRSFCINKHKLCTFWSVLGECENNPGYMQTNCGPVCNSCEVRFLPCWQMA
jgi:prolyl 4-hydroxylase